MRVPRRTFHSVVGGDVSQAVVDFAAGANATMIIVGTSRHGGSAVFTGYDGRRIALLAGSIDVHLVTHEQGAGIGRRWYASPLGRQRLVAGLVLSGGCCRCHATTALHRLSDPDQLPLDVLPRGHRPRRARSSAWSPRWSPRRRLPPHELVLHAAEGATITEVNIVALVVLRRGRHLRVADCGRPAS